MPEALMVPAPGTTKLLGLKKNIGAIEVERMSDKFREMKTTPRRSLCRGRSTRKIRDEGSVIELQKSRHQVL